MLFLSKIIPLPSKTPKTGGFLRRLLQHNGRVQASYASCQGSSLPQVRILFFSIRLLCCCYRKQMVWCKSKLAPSMLFPSKIISLPSKTPKNGSLLRKFLQHNGRVLTCCELYQGSSLVQVGFFQLGFVLLLQETNCML